MPVCSICGRTLKNKTVLKVHELYCKGPQANTEKNPIDTSVKDEPDDVKSTSEKGNEEILQDVEDEPEKPYPGSHTHVKPAQIPNPSNGEVSDSPPPEEKKKGFFQQVEDELSGKTVDTEMEKKGNLSIDEELNA